MPWSRVWFFASDGKNLPRPDKEYTFKVNVCYKCHWIEFLYVAISSMKRICLLCKGVWWLQLFLPSRSLANCRELCQWPSAYSKPLEANVGNTEGSNDVCLGANQAPHISQTHRSIQIGIDLERSLVQPLVQRRAMLRWSLLRTLSGWI